MPRSSPRRLSGAATGFRPAGRLPGEDRRRAAADRLDGADHQEDRRGGAARDRAHQPGRRHQGLPRAVHPARRPGTAHGRRRRREVPGRGRAGAAITGTVSSGVTGPIISSVTAPSKVVQITCCSTASAFTLDGRSQGYFFRTLPTSKTQAFATASEIARRGLKKTAVIYVNTDFGVDMIRFNKPALPKLGGEFVVEVPYNDNQPSYRAEVTKALAAKPESLLLIGFPKDAVTIVREWLSLGGSQQIALNNSMRVMDFVNGVGAKFLDESFGMDNAQVAGPTRGCLQQGVRGEVQDRQQGTRRAHAVRRRDGDGAGDEHRQGPDRTVDQGRGAHGPHCRRHPGRHRARRVQEGTRSSSRLASRSSTSARPARSSSTRTATSPARRWCGRSRTARS